MGNYKKVKFIEKNDTLNLPTYTAGYVFQCFKDLDDNQILHIYLPQEDMLKVNQNKNQYSKFVNITQLLTTLMDTTSLNSLEFVAEVVPFKQENYASLDNLEKNPNSRQILILPGEAIELLKGNFIQISDSYTIIGVLRDLYEKKIGIEFIVDNSYEVSKVVTFLSLITDCNKPIRKKISIQLDNTIEAEKFVKDYYKSVEESYDKTITVDYSPEIPDVKKETFQSTKLIDGFSTCFRQWRAEGTHCKYLHGYSISFKITFEGELDMKNWVFDFGFSKRLMVYNESVDANGMISAGCEPIKQWFEYMFDHTTVIAESDPELEKFKELDKAGVIQLRIIPEVGCELFAKFVYDKLQPLVNKDTNGRVKIVSVECFEHNKNSAIYIN